MPEKASILVQSGEGLAPSSQRVLITDDDAASRTTIAALLSPEGYRLQFAASGEEALAAVEQSRPDLVLLDVMMPGIDGFEVCRRLRERYRTDYIPIVLVTALGAREDILQGLQAGADDFLHKPVYGAELRARVANLLKVRAYHRLLASQRDSALAAVETLRQQVLHADRLAMLGTFAAGVSHELNNIAQVLRSTLEAQGPGSFGEGGVEGESPRKMLTHVASHVTELARTILRIARPSGESLPEVNLGQTLEEVRDMLRLTGRTRHVRVSLVLPEKSCIIPANPVHAQQVFLNLIGNAADAVEGLHEPLIEAGVQAFPDGRVEAWVRDNGPGIPDEILPRIFEPFFTTKPPGFGTGLGLPVVKQIVESWGGRLRVQSQPGWGTRMVVEVPVASTPSTPRRPS